MRIYIICSVCGECVYKTTRKDFESFSNDEVATHFQVNHPEKIVGGFGIPYQYEHIEEDVR